jgi:hypothetical protein
MSSLNLPVDGCFKRHIALAETHPQANRRLPTLLPNGKVVVVGGAADSTTALATAEFYDPTSGTFAPTPP